MKTIPCLVIGSGPAGYTAAIYTQRAGIDTIICEGPQPGGQLTTTTIIENFPGFAQGIDATTLMDSMKQQAIHLGAQVLPLSVTSVDFSSHPYQITLEDQSQLVAQTVIIATGASAKYLGLADEVKYQGMGVSACATCDGFFYRKKTVAVVGGGDTACEEASYLASLASKVYLIVRKPFMRASAVMQKRVTDNPKIEILYETNTVGLFGDNGIEGVTLVHKKGTPEEHQYQLPIDGFFLAIGHRPNSEIFQKWIDTDDMGYIITQGKTPLTNMPGIFAAGDVADPLYRQAVIAAASGAAAGIEAGKFLATLK